MLRANAIESHVPRTLERRLEHPLGVDREVHGGSRQRRRLLGGAPLGPAGAHSFPGAVDGDAGIEEPAWGAVLGDEAEEEVLVADHRLA